VDYGLRLSCITFDNPVSLFSISLDFSRQMRTSRLLLALGAIQLLIMFTCIALPSIRSSVPKRASSLAAQPVLPQPPSPPPFEWHIDLAAPALHTSNEAKLKPYELWLMPPSPPLRLVQQQQQQQQQLPSLRASGSEDLKAHANARSPSSRKLNPKYAMKFNQEALKQQQQQHQSHSESDGASRPSSPSLNMFQSRSTTCEGAVSFRCHWQQLNL
jgi:hypothetical protein